MRRKGTKRKRGQHQKEKEAAAAAEASSSLDNHMEPEEKPQKEEEAAAAAEASSSQDNHKEPEEKPQTEEEDKKRTKAPAAPSRAKRVKKSSKKPEPEPEPQYFEDKRNLEDLWKSAFPVGTEWDQLDKVYEFNWNFSNLEDAFEEDGILHGKKVYLFGCSEPQLVSVKGIEKVICIPAVVAVVSPFPPSDKIGIKSVQRENEEIVPMKQMKMDWVPYIPLEKRDSQVDRLKSQIFILSCNQRRVALKHLKIEQVKKFEYCLPYFYNPLKEDEFEQSTEVQIIFPAEPKPVFCEFDWTMDELDVFTDELIQDEALSEDQKDAFKEFVKEKVREAKRTNREAREARQKTLQEMSEEMKKAYENMRFYKFYPVESPDTPDLSKVKAPFINRYYGRAHEVL